MISEARLNPSILLVLMERIPGFNATDHLTRFSENFVFYIPCASKEKIRIADRSLAHIAGKGEFFLFEGPARIECIAHVQSFL